MDTGILTQLLEQAYPHESGRIIAALKSDFRESNAGPRTTPTIYVVYPESFGNLDGLTAQLPRIRALGCDAIHVLPFLKSPLIDAGYDVSDFLHVREEIGGDAAFDRLLAAAKANRLKVITDVVINHVSDQHEWAIKAKEGSAYHQALFITRKEPPRLLARGRDREGSWAEYLDEKRRVRFPIVFPEQSGENPHWVAHGGSWYFHTFYPQQLDLNWRNPAVFIEIEKIFAYWAHKGLSFRLDASPHIGKDVQAGEFAGTALSFLLIESLRAFLDLTRPDAFLLAEAVQPESVIARYLDHNGRRGADYAYDFGLAAATWTSLITKDARPLARTLASRRSCDRRVVLLRTHDQLMFQGGPAPVARALARRGAAFEGGIAGRTASFLDGDLRRILLAHAILGSLPGAIACYYGDELGLENNQKHASLVRAAKRRAGADAAIDLRDIHRAPVRKKDFTSVAARTLSPAIARMLAVRAQHQFAQPRIARAAHALFKVSYAEDGKTLTCVANLTDKSQRTRIAGEPLLLINGASHNKGMLVLPPYGAGWTLKMCASPGPSLR